MNRNALQPMITSALQLMSSNAVLSMNNNAPQLLSSNAQLSMTGSAEQFTILSMSSSAAQSHSRLAAQPTRLSVMEHQVPQDQSVPLAEMDMEAAVLGMPVEVLGMEVVAMETPMVVAMAVEAALLVPVMAASPEERDSWISQVTQDLEL